MTTSTDHDGIGAGAMHPTTTPAATTDEVMQLVSAYGKATVHSEKRARWGNQCSWQQAVTAEHEARQAVRDAVEILAAQVQATRSDAVLLAAAIVVFANDYSGNDDYADRIAWALEWDKDAIAAFQRVHGSLTPAAAPPAEQEDEG